MNRTINNLAAIISMSLALTALTAASSEAEKPIVQPKVEMVAQISQPIGNLTFTPDNRKFFSIHPFYKPQIRVAELTSPTTFKPFPNLSWNTPQKNSDLFLNDVLGIRGDENGIVWILDMGNRSKVTPLVILWTDEWSLTLSPQNPRHPR